jgi:SAM-dependent methyltransferase
MRYSNSSRQYVRDRIDTAEREELRLAFERNQLAESTPCDFVEELYAAETLNFTGRGPALGEGPEAFSLQWFLEIENRRLTRHGSWLPRLLEFSKHTSEKLLGLGSGLGTDWVQYARHGASVTTCSPTAGRLALVRRNFELRGLNGSFLHAAPEALPLESASIDVVCISSLLEPVGDPARAVAEIYRVLKPGGKVLALVPAKYDVAFWTSVLVPWHAWWRDKAPGALRGQPLSARRLRKLFAPFVDPRIHKRQLRRREIPVLWRFLPLDLLQRLTGRILVLKAFKPLSAAMTMPLAA